MRDTPPDLYKYLVLGPSVVLLLTVAHGVLDLFIDKSPFQAFLTAAASALQIVTLSIGYGLARRWGWSRKVSLTLAILVSVAFGSIAVTAHSGPLTPPIHHWLIAFVVVGMGISGCWLLAFYLPWNLHEVRMRALNAEAALRKAELTRLRSTLHPHFLLNTLNAVAGLLVVEPKEARQLVSALGDLLRDSLEGDGEMSSLEQEVEWLRRFAEIFEIRHRGSIRFEWDLAAETLKTALPRLLLQPLLENAIEHGALHRPGGGAVTLRSRTAGDTIQIAVCDDGPGMKADRPSGLGLRLVEDRLRLAYPTARMVIDTDQSGTRVTLELPKMEKSP